MGGAFIADLVETATGVNLWREWARLEVANLRGEAYALPATHESYAGSVLCLAQTAEPDTAAFDAPEIVVRMKKHHHAGLIVRSETPERVRELLEEYSAEFAHRFLASMPPPESRPRRTAATPDDDLGTLITLQAMLQEGIYISDGNDVDKYQLVGMLIFEKT